MSYRSRIIFLFLPALFLTTGQASGESMKVRAFALKEGTFAARPTAGSGQGIDVSDQIQKKFEINLAEVPGAQAVYLPKDRSLVVRAPQDTISSLRNRLGRAIDRTRPAASGTPAVMQARLDAIMLPEVKFNGASSKAVAEYIRQMAEPYGIAVQLLATSPPEAAPTVNLDLRQVPLSVILKFYTSLTNLQHRIQARDVVVEY